MCDELRQTVNGQNSMRQWANGSRALFRSHAEHSESVPGTKLSPLGVRLLVLGH